MRRPRLVLAGTREMSSQQRRHLESAKSLNMVAQRVLGRIARSLRSSYSDLRTPSVQPVHAVLKGLRCLHMLADASA